MAPTPIASQRSPNKHWDNTDAKKQLKIWNETGRVVGPQPNKVRRAIKRKPLQEQWKVEHKEEWQKLEKALEERLRAWVNDMAANRSPVLENPQGGLAMSFPLAELQARYFCLWYYPVLRHCR
jgi:hypothetical protein